MRESFCLEMLPFTSKCDAQGYYKMEEQTREVLKDGWVYSGDIGSWTPEGRLVLIDRLLLEIVTILCFLLLFKSLKYSLRDEVYY